MLSEIDGGTPACAGPSGPAAILLIEEISMHSTGTSVRARFALLALSVAAASALLSAAAIRPASAQGFEAAVNWVAVGPDGPSIGSGKVNAFAYDEKNPKVMYFGGGWGNTPRESPSQSGIWGTTDGGTHWTALDSGLTNADGTISGVINGLWLDQTDPSVLLAATEFGGTFRSTDGGSTWKNVDQNESTQFAQVAKTLYVASRAGVLVSTDNGASWTVSLADKSGASTVVTAAGATFAGDMAGDVYRLKGATWTKTGHPGTGPVHNIAVDPFNTKIVYANVDDAAAWNEDLYGSIDGGKHWTGPIGSWSIGPQAIAFSQVVKDRLYVGDDGGGAIFYFIADGNPNPVINAGAQPYGVDMRYIFVGKGSSKTDDACYLGMDQGLFYTPTCTSGTAPGLNNDVPDTLDYDVKVTPDGKEAVAPLQDNSIAASVDGGKDWIYPGAAADVGEGGEAFIDPKNANDCYFAHPDGGLFLSSSGCGNFSGPVTSGAESLTFDPAKTGKMYVIVNADANADVDVTTNGGSTWNSTGWKFTDPYFVAVSPSDAKTIVVATGTATSPNHLYYTDDGGKKWTEASGLPKRVSAQQGTIYFATHRFYATFDPASPTTLLLCDHDPATDNILVYRSTDDAKSFVHVKTFVQPTPPRKWPNLVFPTSDERVTSKIPYYATRFYGNRLAFNPDAGKDVTPAIVLTTRFGAFASFDTGSTWARIDLTSITHQFEGLGWSKGYVYLASYGQGVIRSEKPLQ
jgi:hypothetical protein